MARTGARARSGLLTHERQVRASSAKTGFGVAYAREDSGRLGMAIHSGRVRTCFVVLVLVGLTACVTPRQEGSRASYRHCASGAGCPQVEPVRGTQVGAPRGEVGPIQSELLDVDYFQGLLVRAGVPPEQLPDSRRGLSPAEAVRLLTRVLSL